MNEEHAKKIKINQLIFGTNYFGSKAMAYRYFARQGDDRATVDQKIKEKLIYCTGLPDVKAGQELCFNYDEGRYFIREKG